MKRITDTAYNFIKKKIIYGEYQPMSTLTEEIIQNELQCSRTPVREAFVRLYDEGFIVIFPKRGTIISPIDRKLIDEVYEARMLNEPYICQKASKMMPQDILWDLKNSLTGDSSLNEEQLRSYYIDLDDKIHKNILHFCNNRIIVKTMNLIYDHNARFRFFASNPVHDHSIEEHKMIIDAIIKGDKDEIFKCSLQHIEKSKGITIDAFETQSLITPFSL